jgi:hypothetical protein
MGVDLEWQNENGRVLDGTGDPRNEFSLALSSGEPAGTFCLGFIDLYGDTLFNQLQIPDLLREMQQLARSTGASQTLPRMIELVEKAQGETHTYLNFLGD